MQAITVRPYFKGDFPGIMELWTATGLSRPERGDDEATVERSIALGGMMLVMCGGDTDRETGRTGSDTDSDTGSETGNDTGSETGNDTGSETGSDIIGTSWMTFDGRRIHLHHFGITPSFQGKGLSGLLLKESLRFIKGKGYQVKLEVHRSNRTAIHLYKKAGFEYLGDYDIYIIRDIQSLEI